MRRLDAERALGDWGERNQVEIAILRVPGFTPPIVCRSSAWRAALRSFGRRRTSYTNHIHADDLAGILVAALESARVGDVYNASDDGPMKMGDFSTSWRSQRSGSAPAHLAREAARLVPPNCFLS